MTKTMNLYSKYKYIWEQVDNNMDSLFIYIQQYPIIEMDGYGNITVCNTSKKTGLPVFCCHLDTVHEKEPDIELIKDDILISLDGGGIGGDDKCGIIACLELLQKIPCKCIFFRDEERGCVGSRQYNAKALKDDLFCIEIDRRGSSDLIFSACKGQMCSEEFQGRVKKAFPHGVPALGSLTDVCVLDEANINMMNLSAGYYRPHTDKEYVVLSELQRNIDCLITLAKDLTEKPLKDMSYKRRKDYGIAKYTQKVWSKQNDKKSQETLFPANTGYGRFYQYGQEPYQYPDDAGTDDYEALQYGKYGDKKS